MRDFLRNAILSITPASWRLLLRNKADIIKNRHFLSQLRSRILEYYHGKSLSEEELEVINYLKDKPVSVFPYDFQQNYRKSDVEVQTDAHTGLRYVLHDGNKMFFKRDLSVESIKGLYVGLQLDQDKDSPHLYLTADFNVGSEDVIADIGAAEGNFSLSNVEKVKRIFIFEYDPGWIEALQETFKPWPHKVNIVPRYVTDTTSAGSISFDEFSSAEEEITFLKVDIEGEEENFLKGATKFLSLSRNIKIAICTYHKQNDLMKFTDILRQYGFTIEHSKRFMLFIFDRTLAPPYFRRGLIRATKNNGG